MSSRKRYAKLAPPERAEREATRRREYARFIHSGAWRATRKRLMAARGKQCERCGAKARRLEVHHLTYERFGGQELDTDLVVWCHLCHMDQHGGKVIDRRPTTAEQERERKIDRNTRKVRAKVIRRRKRNAVNWDKVNPSGNWDFRAEYLKTLKH